MDHRPQSSSSSISPHVALEALVAQSGVDVRDSTLYPHTDTPQTHPAKMSSSNGDPSKSYPGHINARAGSSSSSSNPDSPLSQSQPRPQSQSDAQAQTRAQDRPEPRQTISRQQLHTPPLEPDEPTPARMFVRAKFDFDATDPSALSFREGDVIEVYTKLESGWWDGLLGTTRGWFPSNYVDVIPTSEVLGPSVPLPPLPTAANGHHANINEQNGRNLRLREDDDQTEESANGEESENIGWADAMGNQAWNNSDLDDLARQVMQGAGAHFDDLNATHEDDNDFETIAADRRRRQMQSADQAYAAAMSDLGPEEMDEFGVRPRGSRQREDTEKTVMLKPSPMSPGDTIKETQVDGEEQEGEVNKPGASAWNEDEDEKGNEESAWIPTLTPDGQVYYHNLITGEDTWQLPAAAPSAEEQESYYDEDNHFFNSITASSSQAFGRASSSVETPDTGIEDTFQAPLHKHDDLPHPWVARMTDDGREWYYVNRITGQSQRHRPQASDDVEDRMERLNVSSSNILPVRPTRPKVRQSVEIRRKAVEDWTTKTRQAMRDVLAKPPPHPMIWHMDAVQDSLRDVFEAAVAGSAAEEELNRASAMGEDRDVDDALARGEAAIQMLRGGHRSLLISLRSLLSAYGYVGPLDGMIELPRPPWAQDHALVGALGLLATNIHAAVSSKRAPESGMSNWTEVMRAAHKLKDILASFPSWITPVGSNAARDAKVGKMTIATMNVEQAGKLLYGRWGFGDMEAVQSLKPLDQAFLTELRTSKEVYDKVDLRPETVIDVLRSASQFKVLSLKVDIAEKVDVDGDMSDRTREEDAQAYHELVVRVGNALLDLEEATAAIDELSITLLHQLEEGVNAHQQLSSFIALSYDSMTLLLKLSTEQKALADRGNLRHQIGHRSPRYIAPRPTATRPQSIVSILSRMSRKSRGKGLEEEFLDGPDGSLEEYEAERRDRAGELASASTNASQTSLGQHQQQYRRGDVSAVSATSSTTSLGYGQAESDGGSVRAKRTSIMKFMKGRSSTDDDGRSMSRKGTSKKLAKLLGEDYTAFPSVPGPVPALPLAPPAPPETPWYLCEDYAPEDIVLDDNGAVRAGTLPALVARLTHHGSTDTSFFQAFLLTFRSFTTGPELVDLLIDRYHIQPPEQLTEAEFEDWKRMKQTPIRIRVSNTLKGWLDVHYLPDRDADVLDHIEDFAKTTLLENGSELLCRQLVALVTRRRTGETDPQRRIVSGGLLSPPAPLVPRGPPNKLKITDIHAVELARQLTLHESSSFGRIQPVELLNKAWQDQDRDKAAPNVRYVIKLANLISVWVTATILGVKDTKARASMFKFFVQICLSLRDLNNFSSMASVMAGLNSAPILRLKRTQDLLSQKTKLQKADLDKLMDSTKNFSYYKDMLKTINPPVVPFLGFWLSALTFIEDGNKDYISYTPNSAKSGLNTSTSSSALPNSASSSSLASASSRPVLSITTATPASGSATTPATTTDTTTQPKPLINFFKRNLTSDILRDIQQYQSQPYNLARCGVVHEWLMKQLLALEKSAPDMQALYDISLALEPREREEERITRMLHDSGFI